VLSRKAIWFTQVAALEDAFEGSYPVPTAQRLRAIAGTVDTLELPPDISAQYVPSYSERKLALLRERVYVNCWYSGMNESAALWQWAERKGQSVAIRTTVNRLVTSIPSIDDIHTGRVRYLNYQHDDVPFRHRLGIFFCKRKSFQHEYEVRLLQELPESDRPPEGIAVPVDLSKLIQRVVVAPGAADWKTEVVRSLLERFGLTDLANLVHKSEMDKDPIY
jgi:hypothetical protein